VSGIAGVREMLYTRNTQEHLCEENTKAPELRHLIFKGCHTTTSKINNSAYPSVSVEALLVPNEEKFLHKMSHFLGNPISPYLLGSIKKEVVHYYQASGYPIVNAVVPEQDITQGQLVIVVVIGELGAVDSEGAKFFSNEKIAAMIRTKSGESIRSNRMGEDLDWINNNPFRSTQLIYKPGSELGTTDVTLLTKDHFPLKVYGGYQNTGNIIAGRSRYYSGIDYGNLWGIGHRINYQWTFADSFNKWHAQSGNYIIPLPWRNYLEFFGAYVKTKPPKNEDTDLDGNSWQIRSRYLIPFRTFGSWKNNVSISYEFKRTNNFLAFATDQTFDSSIDISQFVVGYGCDIIYQKGISSFEVLLYISPGGMTAYNHDDNFSQERSGAKSNYIYGTLRVDQTLTLPWKFSWVINTLFQQASGKLLPSEEISLGGYATVRGYDENEVIGDNGLLIKNELRSPPLSMFKNKKISHQLQFLIFLDFGYTYDADESILVDATEVLASVGPGIRYTFGEYLTLRFDYGWQLDSIIRKVDDSHRHSMGHFGLQASF
jgi:hemolysin activation/secretion protein